jgi:thiamine biosynthesis lipoprotein
MGTEVVVASRDGLGAESTRELFATVESTCSRFLPDSELTAVNLASEDRIELSPLLAELLGAASEMRHRTGGLVDVGLGAAVAAWGYDRTFEEVRPRRTAPGAMLQLPEWRLDGSTLLRRPGVAIDLGGIAKGWTCDRAVAEGLATMVSAGGDVRSSDPEIEVEIVDPWDKVAAVIPLGVGALATSSTTRRRWSVGATVAHHIIDPATMAPAVTPVLSATVVATTAVEAEAGAKAVVLAGADGLAWASRRRWIRGALVVWDDGSVYATRGLEVAA